MIVEYPESLRAYLDRIQSVSRFGRKPKPVVYIDMETRSTLSMDPGSDVLCGAYKIGDGPVHMLPWPTVPLCRGEVDWSAIVLDESHRLKDNYSWLKRKFLTFAAWARKISGQSTSG